MRAGIMRVCAWSVRVNVKSVGSTPSYSRSEATPNAAKRQNNELATPNSMGNLSFIIIPPESQQQNPKRVPAVFTKMNRAVKKLFIFSNKLSKIGNYETNT